MSVFSTTFLYWILTNIIVWLLEQLILYPTLNQKISQSRTVPLRNFLGVVIDNKLDFTEHPNTVCKKANLKLHALNSISRILPREQHLLIINDYIKSLFNYGLDLDLLWFGSSATGVYVSKYESQAVLTFII